MVFINGRVWPNGEFCLWTTNPRAEGEPEKAPTIGLSKVANSHSLDERQFDRLQRGVNGITHYGQKMVKNAAYLLQQKYKAKRLSFLTCTIPGNAGQTEVIAESWSEILRIFLQSLKRQLLRRGLSPAIVGVTEIQPKRRARLGGMPLHLHLVFQGAHRDFQWQLSPKLLTDLWRRAVCSRCPWASKLSWTASTNVQAVKNNAAGYLGKYMSKGEDDIQSILDDDPDLIFCLPKSWYFLTKEARDAVKLHTVEGGETGRILERWKQWNDALDHPFKYARDVDLKDDEGVTIARFTVGVVQAHWKRSVGLRVREYEICVL